MHVATPDHDIPLTPVAKRFRVQRAVCLGLLPFLALPLLLVTADRLAPVDHGAPVDVRSIDGAPSRAAAPEPADELAGSATSTTTTSSTSTTTTVPAASAQVRSAVKAPVAPTTTVPAITAAPTTAPPVTAPPVTAPPAPVAAPAPTAPPTTAAPATTVPPTTAAPQPANVQSGQATWYRWKAGNCAHNSLPMGTRITVRATASGRTATCVVGDRGAFRNPTIIDLDASVFSQIAPLGAGRIAVTISW